MDFQSHKKREGKTISMAWALRFRRFLFEPADGKGGSPFPSEIVVASIPDDASNPGKDHIRGSEIRNIDVAF